MGKSTAHCVIDYVPRRMYKLRLIFYLERPQKTPALQLRHPYEYEYERALYSCRAFTYIPFFLLAGYVS